MLWCRVAGASILALLVIIALGESVIAIGAGVDVEHLAVATIAAVVLALVLPAALWWTYFTDASAAEHALGRAEPERRSALAVRAYVALYLLGVGHVRRVLAIATPARHFIAAVVALGTIPLGALGASVGQLAALALLVIVVIVTGPRVVGHDVAI